MHGRNRNDGEKEQCTGNITPKLVCEWLQWLDIFVGRAYFEFFVRFENTAINARRHVGSNQLCLLALSGSDRRVVALLLVGVDCAVLCCVCGAKKA